MTSHPWQTDTRADTVKILIVFFLSGEGSVNHEVSGLFASKSDKGEASSSTKQATSSNIIDRCDELLRKLKSQPAKSGSTRKRLKKRAALRPPKRQREDRPLTKRIVVLDYPGEHVDEVTPVSESDVLVDGFFGIDPEDLEYDIRGKIQEMIKKKIREGRDFRLVSRTDFEFIRVSNKKARVPDGSIQMQYDTITKMYPSGAVYVRLTKHFEVRLGMWSPQASSKPVQVP